tara:strand:+ start:487 stop:1677 length:1191 start_codon:yes stop_codon:yes gene_type:complete
MLKGKNVLLGVCGSIAAYKAALIVRLLVKKGANVKVLMTPSSVDFIKPLTFSTLSKNPVYSTYFEEESGLWNNHVDLAKWADFMLIAPATQNTIAKMANGICDNLLMATYFSMQNIVYVAPAMDLDMYQHPANKENLRKLKEFGNHLIPAETGELASGLYGEGRMAEPETILQAIDQQKATLKGQTVLITAGPTYEQIDPVRFIGNHSSGKMGYELAKDAVRRGAKVILISGPSNEVAPYVDTFIAVTSSNEMFEAVKKYQKKATIFIMSAAVSDYQVKKVAVDKIKKSDASLTIDLEPTIDILKYVGQNKTNKQYVVGFALETFNEEANAKEKLQKKNCDLIVLNSLKNQGSGFGFDTNQITIFDKNNKKTTFELKSKAAVAVDILNHIQKLWIS